MERMIKILTPLVAIVCVVIMELTALSYGVNGRGLALAIGGVCGLGGYGIKILVNHVNSKGGK